MAPVPIVAPAQKDVAVLVRRLAEAVALGAQHIKEGGPASLVHPVEIRQLAHRRPLVKAVGGRKTGEDQRDLGVGSAGRCGARPQQRDELLGLWRLPVPFALNVRLIPKLESAHLWAARRIVNAVAVVALDHGAHEGGVVGVIVGWPRRVAVEQHARLKFGRSGGDLARPCRGALKAPDQRDPGGVGGGGNPVVLGPG